jgi:hypothetical protein
VIISGSVKAENTSDTGLRISISAFATASRFEFAVLAMGYTSCRNSIKRPDTNATRRLHIHSIGHDGHTGRRAGVSQGVPRARVRQRRFAEPSPIAELDASRHA